MGGLASACRGSNTRPIVVLLVFLAGLLLVPTASLQQQPRTLFVNNADSTCQGQSPCYATIQAAVDAAQPGDTIRIQPGTYQEQVSIQGKNNVATADEPDRIVIEADPTAAPGSVVLQGAVTGCTNGHAIRLQQSKFITIRGLTITGAGGQAISLLGGNNQNQAIHLERNRIFGNGSPECNGGITIARGNPGTLILNNLIYANGRNGITFIDADGGPHHLIENTLHANQWNGLRVARSHEVFLVSNILTGNGTAEGSTGGRFGVSREDSTSPQPEGIHLLHNLICGNRLGEINGPALDPTDANNLTPTGSEGSGVLASAGCDLPATVYANLNGADGLSNTADDDFTLAPGSPAIDHGLDPRTLGLDLRFNPLLEADYAAPAARPKDGDQNGMAEFDLGGLEFAPEGNPPTIIALNPTSAAAGSTISPFTVTGTNLGGATRLDFLLEGGVSDTAITASNLVPSPDGTSLTATVRIDASAVPGSRVVTVTTPGGTSSSIATPENTFTVLPPAPTITGFTPTSGKVGATVTISGSHFRPAASENTVTFTGANNTRVSAPVSAVTTTSLTVAVPTGAVTGPLAVSTSSGTATSTGHFVVLASPDFTLTASPSSTQAVPGSTVAFALQAVPRDGFTGLVNLSVSGLPAGATAAFSPPTLGPSQGGTLSIATGTAASGSFGLTVTGTATIEGASLSHSAAVSITILAAGQTSLVGRIPDTAKQPVPGVTIQIGALTTTTDAAGNFTLLNPPTGTQIVFLDGSTASTADRSYPTIPVTVTITAGQVNTLPFQPHFHVQKARNFTDISNSGVARTVTDAEVPGFALTVPAGVTITGWDGQPNTQISVQPIPRDRLPLPPPPGGGTFTSIYMFYFGKTGGGTPSAPIPVTVPNDIGALPGETLDLFYFDDSTPTQTNTNTWQLGGTGTVTADGKQIVTTSGGIRQFCCGGAAFRRPPPPIPSRPPEGASAAAGEPVDLSTGLFILEKTDLLLPGRLPIVFTRTYRTLDTSPGPFGPGTSHPYEISLQSRGTDLVLLTLPGNSRSLWARGADGLFRNDQVPAYRGAAITPNPDGTRTLRWKDGSAWRFDSSGRLIAQADRNGNTVTISRDSQGRPAVITEPAGRGLTLTYDGSSVRVSTVTDPLGRTVQYAYDGSGRLARVTDPAGGVTTYTYDASGRLFTITDPRGITFLTNEYDANGRVVKQTQADGGAWTFAYTVTGGVVSQTIVTDPRGNATTHRFNTAGFLISQTDALGQTTTFERAFGTNLLLSTTDPLGRVTRFTYDANGNVATITDPQGNIHTFIYEPTFNKVTSITDPLGNLTTFEYDTQGNLLAITDPEQNRRPAADRLKTRLAYNQFGQPVSRTDPLGNSTTFTYDAQGDLVRITDPLGNTTSRDYDLVSRLINQTDPRGVPTQFAYDPLNRLVTVMDAVGSTTAFTYDPNGNLLTVTDARGNTVTHEYDLMDRLSRRTDPLGRAETFSYDTLGNLVSTRDRKLQTSTFAYDPLNRRTRVAYADGAVAVFQYDAAGRLILADDTADPHRPITLEYDGLGRLLAETTALGAVSYAYDALDRRTQMTVSGQAPVAYTYDSASRLTQLVQEPLSPVTMTYDASGRRTLLTLPNGVSTAYQYDPASRLTALIYRNAAGLLGDLTYQYDPAGNRVGVGGSFARTLLPDPVASATYDAANQQLAFSPKTMTFDANGNLTSITEPAGTTTFTWDVRNRLTALSGPGLTGTFGYDALGRRARREISGELREYQYDGLDITRELRNATGVTYLRSLITDEPFTHTDSGTATAMAYLADALGSTVGLTDPSGGLPTNYTYEPFGRSILGGAPSPNLFQYIAREHDAGADLYFYRARYYHPALGRFLSEDPIGLAGGDINLYVYARNNPTRYVDPLGLEVFLVGRQLPVFRLAPNQRPIPTRAYPRPTADPRLRPINEPSPDILPRPWQLRSPFGKEEPFPFDPPCLPGPCVGPAGTVPPLSLGEPGPNPPLPGAREKPRPPQLAPEMPPELWECVREGLCA